VVGAVRLVELAHPEQVRPCESAKTRVSTREDGR